MDVVFDLQVPPSGSGCVECDSSEPPAWWLHLRRCAICGHVGCCDSSPNQHASAHARTLGHRYIQSFEPGEDWFYDYVADRVFSGPELRQPSSRPREQPSPGPRGRVPANWVNSLH